MKNVHSIPTPEMLLVDARGAIERHEPIDLSDYGAVISQLRQKNYSFEKIAKWLGDRLKRTINKGAVFRAFKEWDEARMVEEAEQAEEEFSPPESEDPLVSAVHELAQSLSTEMDEFVESRDLPISVKRSVIAILLKEVELEEEGETAAAAADSKTATVTPD